MYGGMRVIFTASALEETKERLFPESRHRSARIRKKLIKRFGGEFRKVPCMFTTQDTIYAHPSLRAKLEQVTKAVDPYRYTNLFGG